MNEPKPQEPSMEEILASIRRIISEEGTGQGEAAPAAKQDVLELTDVVEEGGSMGKVDAAEPVATEAVPPAELAASAEPAAAPEPDGGAIISETAAAASASTLAELATLVARREVDKGDIPLGRSDKTLEGLVAELLTPLLREWTDRNLPSLIERLVRQEIQRLVRRAEGR